MVNNCWIRINPTRKISCHHKRKEKSSWNKRHETDVIGSKFIAPMNKKKKMSTINGT